MISIAYGIGLIAVLALPLVLTVVAGGSPPPGDPPQVEISNGEIRARIYLPAAQKGFYQGTRFDWSGVVSSLEYQGHNYYGQWYAECDPHVHDFVFRGSESEIVTSPCCKIVGPVEEFQSNHHALGFDEAKVGGTFIKIGIGVLRKDGEEYDAFNQYDLVDGGKWTVHPHHDSVEFIHELADPASGYAYLYRKTVRLVAGKAEMVIEHHLKNTGRQPIRSAVYNHNFLVLDRQTTGPDFSVAFPFNLQALQPAKQDLGEVRGNQFVFLKKLADRDVVYTELSGFSDDTRDNEVRIENRHVGAGMVIRGNRPLSHLALWSIRSVLSVEPFIAMEIAPGSEFDWDVSYEYYTLPTKGN
jgi:hypothetical protein